MAKEMNFSSVAIYSSKLLGVIGIFEEALRIISRNGKIMFFITFITLLSYSLLLLGDHSSQYPVLMDIITRILLLGTKDRQSPEFVKLLIEIRMDFSIIIRVQVIFTIGFCVVKFVSIVATVYTSAAIHHGKDLTLKELILRIGRIWIRPAITWFYVTLLGAGYVLLILTLIVALMVITNGVIAALVFGVLVAALAFLFSLYLTAVWNLGLVASVVEEGCYGMEALGESEELIKGRKLQAIGINLVFAVIGGAIFAVIGFKFITSVLVERRLVILLVMVNVMCLVKIFYFNVYTVFYYQCKKGHRKMMGVRCA